jgi:uncharacterized membrane protein
MHQTVYNTYDGLRTFNWNKILELTDPHGFEQVKRMAVHNDIMLGLLAIFYFIYAGPETLLVLQSVVTGLGAIFVYKIAQVVLKKSKHVNWIALLFGIAYLFNPALERANIYDFHAVVLATTLLLGMFYFWLTKRYIVSFVLFFLAILCKEEIPLDTFCFGLYILYQEWRAKRLKLNNLHPQIYPLAIMMTSVLWFLFSIFIIIPIFNGGQHFAIQRYQDFGDSASGVMIGILQHPANWFRYIFRTDTIRYLFFLLGPVGFFALFSPLTLLIALPEFAINLLSNEWNMRNIIFHYTAVIQPFIFISSIYGFARAQNMIVHLKNFKIKLTQPRLLIYFVILITAFSYFKSPLPYSREADIHPFIYPQKEMIYAQQWADMLKDPTIKISTTGQLAPYFTSREYFYIFSPWYENADYIILRPSEITDYPDKNILIPIYQKLQQDPRYALIDSKENFVVYKKVNLLNSTAQSFNLAN